MILLSVAAAMLASFSAGVGTYTLLTLWNKMSPQPKIYIVSGTAVCIGLAIANLIAIAIEVTP